MPEKRILRQNKKFTSFFKERGMVQSLKAMELVDRFHIGKRRGGDPESSHLYEVAGQSLLMLEGLMTLEELDCLVAGSFMHDLVEDYYDVYPSSSLEEDFSTNVYEIVMNVCKPEGFKKVKEDYEKYYKMVSKDIRSIFMKLSDRIHNLSTCVGGMSNKRILEYCDETELYMYPMISKARKENEKYYMVLTGMKQQLKYRIKMSRMLVELIELKKQN